MISVICVFNNKQVLDECLLKELNNQTVKFELIALDNTKGEFKSAAAALNQGAAKAIGKYLIFVHQDVDLASRTWLAEAEQILESLPDRSIAGVAGVPDGKRIVFTNIKQGLPPSRGVGFTDITAPQKVQTLDECLVIIPKDVFSKLRFDEITCDDWHLYTVDYCLSAVKSGFAAYAIPMSIWHKSIGTLSPSYYRTLKKVLQKHQDIKHVYTTTGVWSTASPLFLQQKVRLIKSALALIGIRYLWRKSGLKSLFQKINS